MMIRQNKICGTEKMFSVEGEGAAVLCSGRNIKVLAQQSFFLQYALSYAKILPLRITEEKR